MARRHGDVVSPGVGRSEALDARGAFAGDTCVHRLEETEPRETLPPFFRVLGVSSEYHSGYAGVG